MSIYVGSVLTANPAAVDGQPTPVRSWQWFRDGVPIAGATGATYTVVEADLAAAITVRQTETNMLGLDDATSLPTDAVLPFSPITLFASGEEGAWYDPSDLTTLYQDSAGTTPVTAAGQPVGLMLDKSKGGLSATELVTNGTFDTDVSGWGDLGAWTAGSVAWNAGQAEVTVSSYAGAAQQFATGALGKWYRVQFDVVSTGNVGRFYVGKASNVGAAASLNVLNLAAGSYSYLVQATYDDMAIGLSSTSGTGTVVYDNISIKELPGNHATQSTSTARPTLAVTGTTPATLGSELVVADSGVVYRDASSSTSYLPGFSVQAGKSYVISYTVSANVGTTSATWRVNTVSNQTTLAPVSGGFNGTVTEVFSAFSSGALGLFGNAAGVDFAIDNVSVKEVLTWADPKYYLDFDGVDDYLGPVTFASPQAQPNTLAISYSLDTFGGIYQHVFDSVQPESTYRHVFFHQQSTNKMNAFAGGIITDSTAQTTSASVAVVGFDSTSSFIRRDGVIKTTNDAGTLGWNGIVLGVRASFNYALDGRIYGFVGLNRTLTTAEIEATESYLADKSGVTLP